MPLSPPAKRIPKRILHWNSHGCRSKHFDYAQCGAPATVKNIFSKTLAKPISCTYICNRLVSQCIQSNMRRDVFQAIADPTRRAIIGLIALQAMTPNALAEHFDTTRQAVSKHLRILTECQLVKQEQAGREIYYHFNPDSMKEVADFIEPFRRMWESKFRQLDTVLSNMKKSKK